MRALRRSVGQALAGACGRRLGGRHLSTNYTIFIHTRSSPAALSNDATGRRLALHRVGTARRRGQRMLPPTPPAVRTTTAALQLVQPPRQRTITGPAQVNQHRETTRGLRAHIVTH